MRRDHQASHFVRVLGASAGPPRRAAAAGLGTLWTQCAGCPDFVARWAEPACDALGAALEDDDPGVRRAAVRGLERVGGERALRALGGALDDPVAYVRQRAILAVGRIGPDTHRARLLAALDEPRPLCLVAAEALGQSRHPTMETIEALQAWAVGSDLYVKRQATESMALLARREQRLRAAVVTRLRQYLAADTVADRGVAVRALGILRPQGWVDDCVQALDDPAPQVRIQAVQVLLRRAGDRAVGLVERCVDDPCLAVRQRMASILAQRRVYGVADVPGVLRLLDRLVDDEQPGVARDAVLAMGAIGAAALPGSDGLAVLSRLRRWLAHRHAPVRAAAARCLVPVGGPGDVDLLLPLFADADSLVRSASAQAAAGLDRRLRGSPRRVRSPLLEPLVVLLRDDDAGTRRSVAWALGDLGDRRAVPPLLQAARRGGLSRWEVHGPLKRLSADPGGLS